MQFYWQKNLDPSDRDRLTSSALIRNWLPLSISRERGHGLKLFKLLRKREKMLQVLSTMSKEIVRGILEQIVACPG